MEIITGIYETREVFIEGKLFSSTPSQKLRNHSPDGFAWGYHGSGPAQLVLALLLHFTGDAKFSLKNYQDFKCDVIAGLHYNSGFVLSAAVVEKWIFNRMA
jgi:hypothetical protein